MADAPLQRSETWRLGLPVKVGMAVVREVVARVAAMMVVVKALVMLRIV